SESALSASNRDTHSHTHTWLSATQDGGVFAAVIFISDGYGAVTEPVTLTDAARTPPGDYSDAQVYVGIFEPSQGQLDADTTEFEFAKTNEMGQIVVIELQGP